MNHERPYRLPRLRNEKSPPEALISPDQWIEEASQSRRSLQAVWKGQIRSRIKVMIALDRQMCRAVNLAFWDGRCPYCESPIDATCTIEHIVPDGSDEFENLIIACSDCNPRRGDRPIEEFLDDLGTSSDEKKEFHRRLAEHTHFMTNPSSLTTEQKQAVLRRLEECGMFDAIYATHPSTQSLANVEGQDRLLSLIFGF